MRFGYARVDLLYCKNLLSIIEMKLVTLDAKRFGYTRASNEKCHECGSSKYVSRLLGPNTLAVGATATLQRSGLINL